MRFKKYINENENATWSDWMKFYKFNKRNAEKMRKQLIKDLKLERVKDSMTKYAGVGKSFDKFYTQDKKYRIEMVGGHGAGGTYKTGKVRAVWRIWDEDRGQYHTGQHKTLDKAKDALLTFLMRNNKIAFSIPKG